MDTLTVLLIFVTSLYLLIYQTSFWKYYLGILIPYYVITQIILCDFKTNTSKKKFFMSTWTHPFDSQIYCSSKVDMTKMYEYLNKYNKEHNCKIGPTIFLLKLVGNLFNKYPKLNGNILFGLFIKKTRIDVSVTVSTDYGKNNEVITIKDADKLSLEEISNKVNQRRENIEHGIDINVGRKRFFMNLLPSFLLSPFLRIISYLSACGLNLSWLGLPKYNYGTAVIVNYGKMGLTDTFLPISPFSYAPFCIGISKIKKYKNKSDDIDYCYSGKILYTIDHRYLDGSIASKLLKDINYTIMNPDVLEDVNYFSDVSSYDSSTNSIPDLSQKKIN